LRRTKIRHDFATNARIRRHSVYWFIFAALVFMALTLHGRIYFR
jgi:hypothetical protein